jgi:hypothetical protein
MYKDKEVKKNVKNICLSMCDVSVNQIFKRQTSRSHYGSKSPVVTITVFKYRNKIGNIALVQKILKWSLGWNNLCKVGDSTHHFFRNACTKSGSLRFSVFRLLTDFVCLYNYEFWLSLCKIVRSSVILLLPLFPGNNSSTKFKISAFALNLSVTCNRSVVFSRFSGFLHW